MELNQKAKKLLSDLRAAIDEALADSSGVLAAMRELEDAGFSPYLSVNIALPKKGSPPPDPVPFDAGLIFTASDESFLRTLGIKTCF